MKFAVTPSYIKYTNMTKEERDEDFRAHMYDSDYSGAQVSTDDFIDTLLEPEAKWAKNISASTKINYIHNQDVIWPLVADYIKYGIDYKDFLKTPYWKAIAEKTKQMAGYKCAICNSNKNLATHHKTYEHHGYELFYIKEDLIVLCDNCHKKFHDKLDNYKEEDYE